MGGASDADDFLREARSKPIRTGAQCCSLSHHVTTIKIYMHQCPVHKARECAVKQTLGKATPESVATNLISVHNGLKCIDAFAYTAD